MRQGLGHDVTHLGLGGDQIATGLREVGFSDTESFCEGLSALDFLVNFCECGAQGGELLRRFVLVGRRLGLADHSFPIGDGLFILSQLGLDLRDFLGSRFAGNLRLRQRGFDDRDARLGVLHGGFGRSERRNEFGETLLGSRHPVDQLRRIARDLGNFAPGRSIEETDFAEPVACDKRLGVVKPHDAGDLIGLLHALGLFEALAIDTPQGARPVGAAGKETTVGREGDRLDIASMRAPTGDLLAGLHLPGRDRAVRGAAREDVGVGAPGQVGDATLVLAEVIEFAPVVGLPDEDIAITIGGREQDTVGTEVGTGDPLGMLGNQVELLARRDIEALHLLGVGSEDDLAVVGRDVGRHDLVELLADLGDTLAGVDVPDDGMPQLAAAAAAHDEERTVGAELQRTRVTFGIRQDAGEIVRIRVVEQDLLLAGDREERGPWARCHRDHRRRTRRHDDRLKEHVRRTGHGAGGLARAASKGEVDLGLVGFLGHASLGLKHAVGDPLGKQRQVLGLERCAFRRHERLFLLRAARPKAACLGIARVDDRTAATAVHQAGVAGQFEPAFLLVGIMTREALVLEQRPDMVVIRQLLPFLPPGGGRDQPRCQDKATTGQPTETREGGGHADGRISG